MNTSKPVNHIQVIDRAVLLLKTLSCYPEPVLLKTLSAETSLSTSTTHRIMASLVHNQLVERSDNGRYMLGQGLLQLSSKLNSDIDIRAVALPIMKELRDKLEETVNLTIREGDAIIYIEKATPNRMMHVQQMIGSRAPLHVTAVGKLILAKGGEQEIRAYAKRTNLPAYTQNTLSTLPELIQECKTAEKLGYALDNEEAEIDVGCVGVLIEDQAGHAIAGLSVSAPIYRRQSSWIEDVKEAGKAISKKLGHAQDSSIPLLLHR